MLLSKIYVNDIRKYWIKIASIRNSAFEFLDIQNLSCSVYVNLFN